MKKFSQSAFIILAVTAIVLIPAARADWKDDFSFSGSFQSVYWDHDPDDWTAGASDIYEGPYSSLENQLLLHADWRNWFAEVKLRNMQYDDGIHYDFRSREAEADVELFKFKAGFRTHDFEITAGDFYKSLGRGIIVYVQEDEDLNLDRTIRGADLKYDHNWFEATVFGGEIEWYEFVDNASEMTYEERKIKDELFGGMLGFDFGSGMNLGLNYATGTIHDFIRGDEVEEDFQAFSGGFEANGLLSDHVDFYVEYAKYIWDNDSPFGITTEDGEAIYSSLTAYLGDFTILAEYKDYDYWDFRYGRPPSADREGDASELDDIKGARFKVDYYIAKTDTLVYLSYGAFDNQGHPDSLGNVNRNEITHLYGGIEQTWEKLYAHLTWGVKEYDDINEKHRKGTADIVYNILDSHSLNLYYEYKFTGVTGSDKEEHKTYLTYSISPYISLTLHYNKHVFDYETLSDSEDHWWAGEVVVTPIDTLSISVLYGGLPTGLLCSGGQCRIVPEFEGIQASLTYSF